MLSGALSTTDSKNPTRSGSFRDDYLLNSVAAGQQIQVNMNSTFDNYLQLINASTKQVIAFNDDTNGNNAQINFTAQAGVSYLLRATSFAANTTGNYTLSTISNNPSFTSFNVFDASGDNTSNSVFEGGATRFSYNLANAATLSNVRLEALRGGSVVSTLGTWSGASLSNQLVNFASFPSLSAGTYQLRAVAQMTSGQEFFSTSQAIAVLSWSRSNGTFAGETLNYAAGLGTGAVILGRGGTDTLNLSGISRSNITSINGISLTAFNPLSGSTANQAIFRGTAFDYMTLSDGREIYLQGIENLRFSDTSTTQLQVRTNDTFFGSQWNLHTSDVDSAWRFTQGASSVLLASLDTGILTAAGASGGIVDISTARLVTDPSDDDNSANNGHGHQAISVMSSTANNASGVSGINWNSDVLVNDVYGSSRLNLQQAIRDTISYARARNQRVVFQGGIQGEFWLNDGGTQAQLEQLIQDNSDIAMFAVAAGNGGIDIDDTTTNPTLSGGVARLQTTHSNVMSVGALERTGSTVNGLANATSVNRASYSNFGSSLTLMAATDSPAMDKFGNMNLFNGTSAANPNMAAIASLVWSVNSSLTGGQLRQVLIDTAMDLGTAGRDNNFGNGLVNADAAVRRASALQRSSDLANLYSGQSLFV
ncbi:MAG: S8 family serine peptidase [Gloeocapsa sp. UFS-A4-WI-NPMV-4B04]|nr:S8 family serine peptidase [Gloeocapsa sp. UFS-A4-WI-NPMV-4B04]